MSTRKIYRIEQMNSQGIANDLVLMAALSNGSGKYTSLDYMEQYIKEEKKKYPVLCQDITASRVDNNILCIDKGTTHLLRLTEVEIMELVDEDSPTLNRYSNTIADETAHELLT